MLTPKIFLDRRKDLQNHLQQKVAHKIKIQSNPRNLYFVLCLLQNQIVVWSCNLTTKRIAAVSPCPWELRSRPSKLYTVFDCCHCQLIFVLLLIFVPLFSCWASSITFYTGYRYLFYCCTCLVYQIAGIFLQYQRLRKFLHNFCVEICQINSLGCLIVECY